MNLNEVYLINEVNNENKSRIWVIVGIIAAVLVVVTLVLITAFVCFKRKNKERVTHEQNINFPNKCEQDKCNKSCDTLNINKLYS